MFEDVTKPYLSTKVDDLEKQQGQIDSIPALTLNIPDKQIIANLNNRIEDALSYWQDPNGFNLKTARAKNIKLYLGKSLDEGQLYRFQIPYNENQIYKSVETIVAYLTSQLPQPEVYPAQDTDQSKILATDLEKGLLGHSQKEHLNQKLEWAVRNMLIKRVGFLYLWFDPDYGKDGDIRVSSINPEHVIVDKNAEQGENPAFICLIRKDSVEQLCYRFPEKKKQIMEALGIKYKTPKQMSQIVAWRQVWITHYDNGEPQEGCVSYFGKLVLNKYKDPNWIYSAPEKNFLDMPMKPFIPFNYINDGSHWIDQTTPVEQAAWIQEVLNKRGRQIMENADTANGMMVIDSDALSMDDAENLTGDPNQKIVIDGNGRPVMESIGQLQARDLPDYVVKDKQDLRSVIGDLMGVPTQFSGDEHNQSDTLGEANIIKEAAAGRQDLVVRAIDFGVDKYFKFLTQMMVVHYTAKHFMTVNAGDGDFDYITLHRNLIEKGKSVTVREGSTLPFDKSQQERIALKLSEDGLIDPLNLYKDLHMDNPQKRFDAWMKWKTDPQSLARDAIDQLDDSTAYIDFIDILGGKKVPGRDDATSEHILTHRKQMITDQFLKTATKNRKILNNMIAHVDAENKSLKMRTQLDMADKAQADAIMGAPGAAPAPTGETPQPPPGSAPQGSPPMGMPPQPGMMPQQGQPPIGQPSIGSVMGQPPMVPPPQ
jgi:hypothetical protein